jgi:hypothetical protein
VKGWRELLPPKPIKAQEFGLMVIYLINNMESTNYGSVLEMLHGDS